MTMRFISLSLPAAIAGCLLLSGAPGLASGPGPAATPVVAAPEPSQAPGLPPAVGDRLLQSVAREVDRPVTALRIAAAEPATWDGCMGLYVPDQICTQVAISGWRLVVTDGQQSWVYHARQDGRRAVLNPTASGSRNGLRVDFMPPPDGEPTPQDVVFRSVESGSLAGWQRDIVLLANGRLIYRENGAVIAQQRLSPGQVAAFQATLEEQRFPNLNRMRYLTDAAFADYPTVRLSAGSTQIDYIDLALADAPPALQAILQAWNDLIQ